MRSCWSLTISDFDYLIQTSENLSKSKRSQLNSFMWLDLSNAIEFGNWLMYVDRCRMMNGGIEEISFWWGIDRGKDVWSTFLCVHQYHLWWIIQYVVDDIDHVVLIRSTVTYHEIRKCIILPAVTVLVFSSDAASGVASAHVWVWDLSPGEDDHIFWTEFQASRKRYGIICWSCECVFKLPYI
jgi:hypothetical protein